MNDEQEAEGSFVHRSSFRVHRSSCSCIIERLLPPNLFRSNDLPSPADGLSYNGTAMLQPDEHLGIYRLIGRIGAGGMGEVWKAEDTRLTRTVAIKILPAAVAS